MCFSDSCKGNCHGQAPLGCYCGVVCIRSAAECCRDVIQQCGDLFNIYG